MHTKALFTNPLTTYYRETFETAFESVTDQADAIHSILNNHRDISSNLIVHAALKKELDDNRKDYKDFNGEYLAYADSKKTVKDAIKEDIHMMILQQNNSYIVGMLVLSAVLITTFLVTKK